ncbi:hypothetical protein NHX12_002279 [Muraenolepis orangiensis]|uniref:PH domain-containing protein n=1 Tax=Muraenolepis orangiensis TaxID=630683 RepID=A0A9Q0DWI9_9TELE|nr:hypothetical protein NHX12_002279 [Muraenolepis orangiensis]
MDPGGGNGNNLKRQRAPLSDSEDNTFSSSEGNDGQKRLRMDRPGQENRSPAPSSSGRSAEQALKPDTPAINSVRSRVQQLTQRQEGGPVLTPRCLSDPGADNLSAILHNKGVTQHLLGENVFHQRLEHFKGPVFQGSPSRDPSSSCPRTCSDFVSGIQQKLQGSLTPSSKQASIIRQEREKELQLLHAQPISENAWLKRSSSDSSISEKGRASPGPSPSTWMPIGFRRKACWPPSHPWEGDEMSGETLVSLEIIEDPAYESLLWGEMEEQGGSSHGEEEMEPSTDEELRLWKYPREQEATVVDSKEGLEVDRESSSAGEVQEKSPGQGAQPEVQDGGDGRILACGPETRKPEEAMEAVLKEEYMDSDSAEVQETEREEVLELGLLDGVQCTTDGPARENPTEEAPPPKGRGNKKKVTFILETESINDSILAESNTSSESSFSGELSSHDETNTAEMIDQMFEDVLEYAERMEGQQGDDKDMEDQDSGIGTFTGDKDKEELLTFPPSGILSPLSKSVEAVVTPLRLAVHQVSNPPSLLLTPEEEATTPPAEAAPLYSIDAYRTQRQNKLPTIQSVTPAIQRRAPEMFRPPPSINTKEKITALSDQAGKLQTVITQTLQALSCCTDETHGRGSLEEAEAEKLLLVSCEKRAALLAEVTRLRGSASEEAVGDAGDYISQQPCRGTVNIGNVQLPLKVEFVCSSRNRKGRPSHYFFLLIRYGPCHIVATPLATAVDAKNGDTISFPTAVNLKDIRSNFEIDVEVYSLSHASGSACLVERISAKPRVTPRKLLSTITRSNNTLTAAALPAMTTRRSSNFCLVGSHKITLASLGQTKFPLDKMKFDGKIRKLLGDEFQEKVPFLSPLEGNVYLQLDSQGHSNVQHQGFLTMFEVVNGFGAWHRRFFALEDSHMFYWNHPNDKEAAEGTISLASSSSQSVKPVKRDSCARPFTFELVSNVHTQLSSDSEEAVAKRWFSSDTKQERCDWMDKLNQALLDLHTWSQPTQAHSQPSEASTSSSSLRESLL